MNIRTFLLAACAFPLANLAQTTFNTHTIQSEKVQIVDPNQGGPDYNPQLIHLEAPSPSGDSYRSFLMRQKIASRSKYPQKPGAYSPRKTSGQIPIVGKGTRLFKRNLPTSPKTDYTGGIPNDNTLALSNSGIALAGINSVLWAWDTNLDTTIFPNQIKSLRLIGGGSSGNSNFDPKLLYDPDADRFILIFLQNNTPANSKIKVCFSSTNNPNDPWYSYVLPGNPLNNNRWSDFPTISFTEDELFLTLNLIIPDVSWQVGFDGSIIWQIDKNQGFAGDSVLTNKLYSDIRHDGKYIRNLHAVCGAEGAADEAFFLSNRNFDITNDTIFLLHLTGTQNDPNTTLNIQALTTNTPYGVPPNGRQQDTDINDPTKGLQTNDARILGAITKDDWIQFVGNTINPATGYAAIYHGFVKNPLNQPEVTGNIIAHPTRDYGYPNIAWTGDEACDHEVLIGFNHTSPTDFAGISAVYFGNDSLYSDPVDIIQGENYADRHSDSYERWGDYFGLQRKYNEPKTTWLAGYFANTNNHNVTWVGKLSSPDSNHFAVNVVETGNPAFCNLTISLEPQGTTAPITFSFNGEPFSANNTLFGVCEGDTVVYQVTDGRGCTVGDTLYFDKIIAPNQPNAFPNPFGTRMAVQFKLPSDQKITAAIFDQTGRLVYKLIEENAKRGDNQLIFDTSPLAAGTYFLRITGSAGFSMEEKMVKVER